MFLWLIIFMIISSAVQNSVRRSMERGHRIPEGTGMTGAKAAEMVLEKKGVSGIIVEEGRFDHYDPKAKAIRLSPENFRNSSVTAVAVALHEAGHAMQHAEKSMSLQVRTAFVPVATLGSSMATPLLLFGFITGAMNLVWLGIIGFAFAVVFHIVTLPVEFDASGRALTMAQGYGFLKSPEEMRAGRKGLGSAALTYIVAALIALVQLIHWIGIARR